MNFLRKLGKPSVVRQIAASEAMFGRLCDEIAHLEHAPMDEQMVTALLAHITVPEHVKQAHALLARSINWQCKYLAVHLDPMLGKVCAEEFMESVRWKQAHVCDPHQLRESREQLVLARYWYKCANALTPELEEEIRRALEMTLKMLHTSGV